MMDWVLLRLRKACGIAALLVFLAVGTAALDRNAFTFTQYNLDVQVELQQQRLSVRGTVMLRNDSGTPQKTAALQVSSSLTWRSIRVGEQAVQFVTQAYTSDIDHTGELSEAIVTLPKEVPSGGTVELTVGYEGVIELDATRLTRISLPQTSAIHSDWDVIGKTFSAVRGIGYGTWYPVAIDAGNLSEGNSLFEVLGSWKAKSAASKMRVNLCAVVPEKSTPWTLLMNDAAQGVGAGGLAGRDHDPNVTQCAEHVFEPLGLITPVFVIADYQSVSGPGVFIYFVPAHNANAESFVQAAQKTAPFVTEWVGATSRTENIVELEDPQAAPFESGTMLLTPLHDTDPKLLQVAMVHELVHAAFASPRPWIEEGLAHFLQAVYRERQDGRAAALDFLGLQRTTVVEAEKAAAGRGKDGPDQSLISTATDELVRSKAAYVWWMLRDLVGEDTLKRALAAYRASDDADLKNSDPKYLQRLLEKESKRDLAWFFDDWVYHDRGLPDFHVAAVFTRVTLAPNHVTTVTVENLGGAAAEVPVTIQFEGGEVQQKVLIKGHDKAVLRIETRGRPTQVALNDGSVPESEMGNNTYKVEAGK